MTVIYKASRKDQGRKESKKKKKAKKEIYRDIANEIHSLAGLTIEPRGVNFVDKSRDENALVVIRRHPVTNIPWVVLTLTMFFIVSPALHFGWLGFLGSGLQAVVIYAWLMLALLVAWSGMLSWYFNVNIISDKRVVDIDLHDLIYREVSDAQLEKIEDVTHSMGGLIGIVFNFGDVYIQTAGTKPQIEFLKVSHPAQIAGTLRKLRDLAEK